jgi:hypothetical protein
MLNVQDAIGPQLVDKFRSLGVRYERVFNGYLDLSWQTAFQTESPEEVALFCRSHDIEFEWLDDATLHTSQTCPGVVDHPKTGVSIFFNQAHLYHPSSLGREAMDLLIKAVGSSRLPRNATFGDGSPIDVDALARIRRSFADDAVDISWQDGDVILLDNVRVAHGRRPYEGGRRLLAALLDERESEWPVGGQLKRKQE